ncbi:MAG: hypothetical protein J5787_07360 [Alphaproteobacteria bacterium]|nr:hypothetical protein [Alphaproteobacteria bacterium]MBO4643894.1 hypothetical protein [Alphaproteobacteria bacterium]
MIRIVWNAFLLGVIALAAAWLSNNPGSVRLEWIGYSVQTSVAVIISVVIIVYAVFYAFLAKPLLLATQKIAYWLGADKRAQKIAKSKIDKEVDRYTLLGKGLTALAAGDIPAAEKLSAQIRKGFADDETKIVVFEAQLAEAKNNTVEAMRLYDELAENPETHLLGMRGKVRLYRLTGNLAQATEVCAELLTMKNPPQWVLSEAFELQIHEQQWAQAIATLEKALKHGLFDKLTAKRLKASVLLEQAAVTTEETEKEKLIREAYETDKTFVRAAVQTAELDIAKGDLKKARRLLQKLWKISPSWAVYEVYLTLTEKETPIEAVKDVEELVAENPEAKINDLIFADCSLRARLWGQAKTSVTKYLEAHPDSKRALMMAQEIAAYNQDEQAAEEYRERAEKAPVELPYFCEVCHTPFEKDHTTCPACHTLGAIHLSEV